MYVGVLTVLGFYNEFVQIQKSIVSQQISSRNLLSCLRMKNFTANPQSVTKKGITMKAAQHTPHRSHCEIPGMKLHLSSGASLKIFQDHRETSRCTKKTSILKYPFQRIIRTDVRSSIPKVVCGWDGI